MTPISKTSEISLQEIQTTILPEITAAFRAYLTAFISCHDRLMEKGKHLEQIEAKMEEAFAAFTVVVEEILSNPRVCALELLRYFCGGNVKESALFRQWIAAHHSESDVLRDEAAEYYKAAARSRNLITLRSWLDAHQTLEPQSFCVALCTWLPERFALPLPELKTLGTELLSQIGKAPCSADIVKAVARLQKGGRLDELYQLIVLLFEQCQVPQGYLVELQSKLQDYLLQKEAKAPILTLVNLLAYNLEPLHRLLSPLGDEAKLREEFNFTMWKSEAACYPSRRHLRVLEVQAEINRKFDDPSSRVALVAYTIKDVIATTCEMRRKSDSSCTTLDSHPAVQALGEEMQCTFYAVPIRLPNHPLLKIPRLLFAKRWESVAGKLGGVVSLMRSYIVSQTKKEVMTALPLHSKASEEAFDCFFQNLLSLMMMPGFHGMIGKNKFKKRFKSIADETTPRLVETFQAVAAQGSPSWQSLHTLLRGQLLSLAEHFQS